MEALALIEIGGWSPAMVVLDAMGKCSGVQVLQTELNDSPGVCMKLCGSLGAIQAAAQAAEESASAMQTRIIVHVIPAPSDLSPAAYQAGPAGPSV
jgi:microcompartment protein CcmL/EutN